MKRKGFSLVELLIGLLIMQIALFSFFAINESSNTQSMDAYYEFLAYSLGKEIIEFTQGMGYEWAMKYKDKPDLFPLDEWFSILEKPIFSSETYFREADTFERRVNFKEVSSGGGVLVTIDVKAKEKTKAKAWLTGNLTRDFITYKIIVMEKPQR